MLHDLKRIWADFRSRSAARRRAKDRAFIRQVISDCFDPRHQAECAARLDRHFGHGAW